MSDSENLKKKRKDKKEKKVPDEILQIGPAIPSDWEEPEDDRPDPRYLRNCCKGLVLGPSNCGKTNALVQMFIMGMPKFDRLYLCLAMPDQKAYNFLREKLEHLVDEGIIEIFEYETIKEMPSIKDMDKRYNNLVVFDDMMEEKDADKKISGFFSKGRHNHVSTFYLSQMLSGREVQIPKSAKRNTDYIFLFGGIPQDDLDSICKNTPCGLDPKSFKKVYAMATKKKYDFLLIDRDPTIEEYRIRRNLTDAIII